MTFAKKISKLIPVMFVFLCISTPAMAVDNGNTSNTDGLDVWGIQKSDMKSSDYANVDLLTKLYSGITPLRNVSLLGIAVSFGLALVCTLVGIFLLVAMAGYGAAHPNHKRGFEIITASKTKIVALGSVFGLALFIVVMMFFVLIIFSRLNLFVS